MTLNCIRWRVLPATGAGPQTLGTVSSFFLKHWDIKQPIIHPLHSSAPALKWEITRSQKQHMASSCIIALLQFHLIAILSLLWSTWTCWVAVFPSFLFFTYCTLHCKHLFTYGKHAQSWKMFFSIMCGLKLVLCTFQVDCHVSLYVTTAFTNTAKARRQCKLKTDTQPHHNISAWPFTLI